MNHSESMEFLISQYVDRTLTPGARAAIETRLTSQPTLAKTLLDYQQIHRLLKSSSAPPEINWHALAKQISSQIPDQSH